MHDSRVVAILLITASLISHTAFAQLLQPMWSAPSPEAASLGEYGAIPVSHFTGTPNVVVPLFELEAGSYRYPVELSYHLASVKPHSQPGVAGLGWMLTDACISRTVRGVCDEKMDADGTAHGYFAHRAKMHNITNAQFDIYTQDSLTAWNPEDVWFELSADEFSFSFNGHSGLFYLNPDGGWTVISDEDILVEFDPESDFLSVADSGIGIASATYNVLNLPTRIIESCGDTVKYLYSASGTKLRETIVPYTPGGGTTRTDYVGNLVYRDGLLARIIVGEGAIISARDSVLTPEYGFSFTDHLGSIRALVFAGDTTFRKTEYGPYGEVLSETSCTFTPVPGVGEDDDEEEEDAGEGNGRQVAATGNGSGNFAGVCNGVRSALPAGIIQTYVGYPYRFGGKERLDAAGLGLYDFGARHYAPASLTAPSTVIPRWLTMDPLAEKYYDLNPYTYCAANPINIIDPTGKDIYRFDKKTGEMILFQTNNDPFDQIGAFKKDRKTGDYLLRQHLSGKPIIKVNHIGKGILSDNMNFKDKDNYIDIISTQLTLEEVEMFLLDFSNMIDREIGGYYLSTSENEIIRYVTIGKYSKNKDDLAFPGGPYNALKGLSSFSVDNYIVRVNYHTHLSKFPDNSRLRPSSDMAGGDLGFKARALTTNPQMLFLIITNPQPFYY